MDTQKRTQLVLLALTSLAVVAFATSLCVGSYPLSRSDVWTLFTGGLQNTMAHRVFWTLRLPRVMMGLLAGFALGSAGGVFQIMFRNPLASPDLTGVAAGSSLGAACAIVLGAGSSLQVAQGAFLSGLLCLAFVLLLVRFTDQNHTVTYILAGIVISSLADAGIMMLKYAADPEKELAAIEFWTMGSLSAVTADKLLPALLGVLPPLFCLLLCARPLLILSMGQEQARSLGLSPRLMQGTILTLTTLMVAAVISITGVISFVGLISPHIAFLLLKRRSGAYLLTSGLVGGCVIVVADLLARSILPGAELPLSILTTLCSVPVLIFFLCRRKGHAYEPLT